MKSFFSIMIVSLLATGSAQAQLSDPSLTCENYLKMAASMATPKTGDAAIDKMAAEVDGKMAAYCKANPKAKAMEAAEKVMMGL